MALTEIIGSRSEQKTARSVYVTRIWECLKSEVTVTAGRLWVGSGITLPAIGDALDIGTWTSRVTPRLVSLRLVPHRTRKKTYIVGTYAAPRISGD